MKANTAATPDMRDRFSKVINAYPKATMDTDYIKTLRDIKEYVEKADPEKASEPQVNVEADSLATTEDPAEAKAAEAKKAKEAADARAAKEAADARAAEEAAEARAAEDPAEARAADEAAEARAAEEAAEARAAEEKKMEEKMVTGGPIEYPNDFEWTPFVCQKDSTDLKNEFPSNALKFLEAANSNEWVRPSENLQNKKYAEAANDLQAAIIEKLQGQNKKMTQTAKNNYNANDKIKQEVKKFLSKERPKSTTWEGTRTTPPSSTRYSMSFIFSLCDAPPSSMQGTDPQGKGLLYSSSSMRPPLYDAGVDRATSKMSPIMLWVRGSTTICVSVHRTGCRSCQT